MVRLYRSPSPGKRRFIENESDLAATRSPICGGSVLGKIISKSQNNNRSNHIVPLSSTSSNGGTHQPEYVSVHQHSKKGLFGGGGGGGGGGDFAYESIGNSPTFAEGGRQSPESTESSTSDASSHGEDDDHHGTKHQPSYALQFEPKLQESSQVAKEGNPADHDEDSDRLQLRMDRLQAWMEQQKLSGSSNASSSSSSQQTQAQSFAIRNRAHIWSTNLPVVTEERSFEAEDSSIASGGAHSMKDEGADQHPDKSMRSYSSPERNEMLLAMRQLVLKQQAALSEMAEENRHYRRDLQECRKLLQLAKEAYTKQQRQMEAFTIEKESNEAEVMWLREEVKTLRSEIYKHQQEEQEAKKATWTSNKSSEEVEERLRRARAETPERKRRSSQIIEEASPTPPSPVRSPVPSPVASPPHNWKLKSILPDMNYLSDEVESDEELVKEFQDIRATLQNTGISAKTIEQKLREHRMAEESRDDGRLSPKMWQDEDSKGPEDEISEWSRSRSPVPSRKLQETVGPDDEMREMARSDSPIPSRKLQESVGPDDEMRELALSCSPVHSNKFRESAMGPEDETHEPPRSHLPLQANTSSQEEDRVRGSLARSLSPSAHAGKTREDEMREWTRSRSPIQDRKSQEISRGRSRQELPSSSSPVPRESSRTPSEISLGSSNSAVSQRSREEVALFKSRLGAIQRKREHRKQIEENVGSRSGRIRFT